jgi:hypothetical protein
MLNCDAKLCALGQRAAKMAGKQYEDAELPDQPQELELSIPVLYAKYECEGSVHRSNGQATCSFLRHVRNTLGT